MGMIVRPFRALAAAVPFVIAAIAGNPASAAVLPYFSSIDLSSTNTTATSNAIRLDFSFSGYFTTIDSITISGNFAGGVIGGWGYLDQFEFTGGSSGPVGYAYFRYSTSNPVSSFSLAIYPSSAGSSGGVTTTAAADPSSDPAAFKTYLFSSLGSGAVTIYFTPLHKAGNAAGNSQFQLQNATLTVVGEDAPIPVASAPVPAGMLLFVSGGLVIWVAGRQRKPKS
jgi:hypothetical protein